MSTVPCLILYCTILYVSICMIPLSSSPSLETRCWILWSPSSPLRWAVLCPPIPPLRPGVESSGPHPLPWDELSSVLLSLPWDQVLNPLVPILSLEMICPLSSSPVSWDQVLNPLVPILSLEMSCPLSSSPSLEMNSWLLTTLAGPTPSQAFMATFCTWKKKLARDATPTWVDGHTSVTCMAKEIRLRVGQ